jgi:hypothetical protein
MLADRCPHDRVRGSGDCGRCGVTLDPNQRPTRSSSHALVREISAKRLAAVFGGTFAPAPVEEARPEKVSHALRGVGPLAGSPAEDYLRRRGVILDDAHGIAGFARSWLGKAPAVVFPCKSTAGKLVALQGRFLAPCEGSPKAMSVGPITAGVFVTRGALEAPVVAIVEAPIDALSLAACGLPALALFGCALGPDRQRMLRRALAWKRVVIATDADAPGEAAAVELRAALTIGTRCLRLPFPAGTKDVNEWLQADRGGLRAALATLSPADAVLEDEPDDLTGYARTVLL